MKKTFLRIQGIKGGTMPVWELMEAMRENGIPFVQANSYQHTGSRETAAYWENGKDLLYALVRVSDIPLVHLINSGCVVKEEPTFNWWRWNNEWNNIPF